jgi:hypothetical protein
MKKPRIEYTPTFGISFVGIIAVLFISLKLTGVVGWSWWWVLSPLLIAPAVLLTVLLLMLVIAIAGEAWDAWERFNIDRKRRKRSQPPY